VHHQIDCSPAAFERFPLVVIVFNLTAIQTSGTMEADSAGWAQTYRIQIWRWARMWTMDRFPTPILNSVRLSRLTRTPESQKVF
jgi:hypothetical protein